LNHTLAPIALLVSFFSTAYLLLMIYHDHLPLRVAWRRGWPFLAAVGVSWMLVYHLSPLGIVALCFLLTIMVSGITEWFMEIGREVSLRRKSKQR
jgi:hypothetical protein